MNSKINNAKKDLRLVYPQGYKTAYSFIFKAMARYMSPQYPNKNLTTQKIHQLSIL